ncbi:MAG: flagellar biosynthesis anti-sigma factor FlgM [Thermodesulfobacteriota bacterium]
MKISDIQQKTNSTQQPKEMEPARPSERQVNSKKLREQSSSSDRVELSVQSKELQKVHELLQKTTDVRSERVSHLKESIQEGRYQVDSEALARKMITEGILELIP